MNLLQRDKNREEIQQHVSIDLAKTFSSQIQIDTYISSTKTNDNYINIDKNKLLSKQESIDCKMTPVIYGT